MSNSALHVARTGLDAQTQRMRVIANNLANVNTTGFKRAWEAKGNQVVAEVVYEPNQPSYRAELQRVLAAKPDVVVMGSFLPDTTIISIAHLSDAERMFVMHDQSCDVSCSLQ